MTNLDLIKKVIIKMDLTVWDITERDMIVTVMTKMVLIN